MLTHKGCQGGRKKMQVGYKVISQCTEVVCQVIANAVHYRHIKVHVKECNK